VGLKMNVTRVTFVLFFRILSFSLSPARQIVKIHSTQLRHSCVLQQTQMLQVRLRI
jgi:hypothetical protein